MTFTSYRRWSVVFFVLLVLSALAVSLPAHAAWNGMPYAPEETLDPECPPTESECRVTLPIHVGEGVPAGALPYTTGPDQWEPLLIGSDGQVLKVQGGTLVWGNDDGGTSYGASGQGLVLDGDTNVFSIALDGNTLTQSGSGLRLSSTYAGQASITTLGTITSGTWQGTPIAPAYGGTGVVGTPGVGQLLIGNGTGYTLATPTGENGISVVGGPGSLTIAFSIDGLSTVSSADNDDYLVFYDDDTGQGRRITVGDLLSELSGALSFQGSWNADTNSPTLNDGMCTSGAEGRFYIVSVGGSTTLGGISSWNAGDWVICDGTDWGRIETTSTVASVFGRTGPITAQTGDYTASQITNVPFGSISATNVQDAINELATEKENAITPGTTAQYWRGDKTWQTLDTAAVAENVLNLYYTDARARGALSSASPALSYDDSTGVFSLANGYSIPQSGTSAGATLVWDGSEWVPNTLLTISTSTNTVTVSGTTNLGPTTATGLTLTQDGLAFDSSTPSDTTNRLYRVGNTLYWNGNAIADDDSALIEAGLTLGGLAYWDGSKWTTTPGLSLDAGILDVEGTVRTTGLIVDGVATTTSIVVNGLTTTSGLLVNGVATIASSTIGNLVAPIAHFTNASTTALSVNDNLSVGVSITAPVINAVAGLRLNGVDINTGGVLSNVAYLNQANTFSNLQVFAGNASTTGLTVSGDAYLGIGGGRVGIGLTDPSYPLHVKGDVGGTVAKFETATGSLLCSLISVTGLLNCVSDRDLKTDIVSLDGASTLEKVLALNPVSYHWKTDDASAGLKYGFIAQEVEEIFPELVMIDAETGYRTLGTSGLIPFIVQALQEQQQEIEALGAASGMALTSSGLDRFAALGALTVSGHVAFGEDTVGWIELPAGDTSVRVTFKEAYAFRPVVTITPEHEVSGAYWVGETASDGFEIRIARTQDDAVRFSWHAFARHGAFFESSNGVTQGTQSSGGTSSGPATGALADPENVSPPDDRTTTPPDTGNPAAQTDPTLNEPVTPVEPVQSQTPMTPEPQTPTPPTSQVPVEPAQ